MFASSGIPADDLPPGYRERLTAVAQVALGLLFGLLGLLSEGRRVLSVLGDLRSFFLCFVEVGLPTGLHGLDQTAANTHDKDPGDGCQDCNEDRGSDGDSNVHLVQRGNDADEDDEATGEVGQEFAVGEPTEGVENQLADASCDGEGDDDDDQRDEPGAAKGGGDGCRIADGSSAAVASGAPSTTGCRLRSLRHRERVASP